MDNGPTEIVMLFVRAANLKGGKSSNMFAAADPFFEVKNDEGEMVARSAIFRNDFNPQWPPIRLDVEALCKGDQARDITLSFYDWNEDGKHVLLGEVTTDLQDIAKAAIRYHDQRSVGFLDKKETYNLGEAGKVYIYDLIQITGFPTEGTLIKKRIGSATPSVADTEPETDSASQSSSDEDNDYPIMTPDSASVCPSAVTVVSGDSTVMHTNGDASPRRKPKHLPEPVQAPPRFSRRNRGKSLFSGELQIMSAGSLLPLHEEVEPEEPLLEAEQRGIARAHNEVADEGHNYEIGSLTGEPDDTFEKVSDAKSTSKATLTPRPPRFPPSPIKSQIDSMMKGAPRRAKVPATNLYNGSTPLSQYEAMLYDQTYDQGAVTVAPSTHGEPCASSPASFRPCNQLPESSLLPLADDLVWVTLPTKMSPVTGSHQNRVIGLLRGDDFLVKTKQCLDRPKKEYLSH